uniref:Uncharacterized protein n=1 Tax=Ananas comosus var. bracteatus TaxID=296719 RepID=A0A6V7PY60_ANACO|nr:unnamed protein product [Ananas comosus var. bracteatus]
MRARYICRVKEHTHIPETDNSILEKISSSYRLTEKRNTYKATRYTLRLSWNTHISASAKKYMVRVLDREAQVRTLPAYHAERTYGVRILMLRSGPFLRIMQIGPTGSGSLSSSPDPLCVSCREDLRGPNPEAQDLRGPDPEAQVRTLSAYHAERTYGVRILLRVRIPNIEKKPAARSSQASRVARSSQASRGSSSFPFAFRAGR